MKKIRTFLPLSIYDIPGIERWLEEQANTGLFPAYLNSWATFEPTGIPGTRFRLEPWGKEGTSPTQEQLELIHQAGCHLFSSSDSCPGQTGCPVPNGP